MINKIQNHFKWKRYIEKWKRINNNNSTYPECFFNIEKVSVGNYTYGGLYVLNYGVEEELVIGSFCSIASRVVFVLNADHDLNRISTFPFEAKILEPNKKEAVSKGNIIVDDDVWIGQNAIILSGVHIGQGAVIAAGAVVSKDVEPYAVVGGVPAHLIKYRFKPQIIDYLLTFDYQSLTNEMIRYHKTDLYETIENLEVDDIKKKYSWFPKKKRMDLDNRRCGQNQFTVHKP